MDLRSLLFLSSLIGFTLAVNFRDLPPQLSGFYPKALAKFYAGLTLDQEKLIDEAILSNSTNREAQYAAAEKKNPELANKFKEVNEDFVQGLNNLSYYANSFYYFRILQRIDMLQQPGTTVDQLNEFAADIIQEWNALTNETQAELESKFPDVVENINSERLAEFANKAPYIKPYLIYLIQKWDMVPPGVRAHLTSQLPELATALTSPKVRAYINGQSVVVEN